MDTDTSSEFNLSDIGLGKDNEDLKKTGTSETNMYLDLLANDNKVIPEQNKEKETSETKVSSSSSSRRSSRRRSSPRNSPPRISTPVRNSPQRSYIDYDSVVKPKVELSPQEIRMRKIDLLRKLSEIKAKGYSLSKEYDFNSSLEEMEYEHELLKSFANKRNGIKLYKSLITNFASVIEFANDRYDPFGAQLSGWSEHMSVEVESYDEVLEQLYEKYKGTGKEMPPEMKLIFLVSASASAFHFSKSHLSNMPGLDKAHQNNPDFIAKLLSKNKSSNYMSQQEVNLQQQREQLMKQQMEEARQRNQFANMMNSTNNTNNQNVQQDTFANTHHPVNHDLNIEKPDLVSQVLSRNLINPNKNIPNVNSDLQNTETEDSANNSRILSDSVSVSSTTGRKKKKKPMMVIT